MSVTWGTSSACRARWLRRLRSKSARRYRRSSKLVLVRPTREIRKPPMLTYWDWDATERELNRAIALAPSYSCAHEDRAQYLSFRGRRSEAEAELTKSLELDKSVSSALTESGVHYQLRDFDRLVEASRRGMA